MLSQNNTRIPRQYWVEGFFFSLIVILGTFLRFFRLNARGFWGDEVWSAERITLPAWRIIIDFIDLPGPIYYLLGHFSLAIIGSNYPEVAMRLPSTVFGSILIIIAYFCVRKIYDKYIALAFSLLLAVCPYLIWYAQDARFYSVVATSLFVVWYAFRQMIVLKERKYWYLWVAASLFSLYTQPLTTSIALVSYGLAGVIYLYIQSKKPRTIPSLFKSILPIITGALAMAVGYSPVILKVLFAVVMGGWFGNYVNFSQGQKVFSPTLDNFVYHNNFFFEYLFRGLAPMDWAYVYVVFALIGLVDLFYRKQWLDAFIGLIPFILTYCIFVFLRPANGFGVRYVIFLQALYLLLVVLGVKTVISWALSRLKNLKSGSTRFSLSLGLQWLCVLCFTGASLYTTYLGYYHFKPNDWRLISNYIKERSQPGDVLIGSAWALQAMSWYFKPSELGLIEMPDQTDIAFRYLKSGNRVWFVNIRSVQGKYGEELRQSMNRIPLEEIFSSTDILPIFLPYYPHSEIMADVFKKEASYGSAYYFRDLLSENPDQSLRQLNPGETTQIYLRSQLRQERILQVRFLAGPDRNLTVQVGNHSWELEPAPSLSWTIEDIELPEDLDLTLPITLKALGDSAIGLNYVRVIEPGSRFLEEDPRTAIYFDEDTQNGEQAALDLPAGKSTTVTLQSFWPHGRNLQISYLAGPERAMRVEIGKHSWEIKTDNGSGWQLTTLPLPEDLDLELQITLTSLGEQANQISFVKVVQNTKAPNEFYFANAATDPQSYRHLNPGDKVSASLKSQSQEDRVLQISYLRGPDRSLTIDLGDHSWEIVANDKVAWVVEEIPIPDDVPLEFTIDITSYGPAANGIKYVRVVNAKGDK
jgi:hypothetical protein